MNMLVEWNTRMWAGCEWSCWYWYSYRHYFVHKSQDLYMQYISFRAYIL